MSDPRITINGVDLDDAQVATMKAAINRFALNLLDPGSEEDHRSLYLGRLAEIDQLMERS